MASDREYLCFVLEQLSQLEEITYRSMMGEFLLYYRGKLFGGIYDNRLLVKLVPAALQKMPEAPREIPYPGAAEMLLVEQMDDPIFLKELMDAMYPELPERKKKRK